MTQQTTSKTWDADLQEMPLGNLPAFYSTAQDQVDARRQLRSDQKHVSRSDKRLMLDARRLQNCLGHVGRLPEPGESVHLVTHGNYSLFDVIRTTLTLASPATMAYLGISTLGFNRYNVEDLAAMLDADQIGRLDFLYSLYFKSNERELCEGLTAELTNRKQRVLSMRTHCKLLLIELTDGRALVVESSANLRSCFNIEQITIHHDAALLTFHRTWIDSVFQEQTK